MPTTGAGPAYEMRRLRENADRAQGETVVTTTTTGVIVAAVSFRGGRVLALHGPDGRPASARLLALAFFAGDGFVSGDFESAEFAVYHGT